MKLYFFAPVAAAALAVGLSGCTHRTYVYAPPPPVYVQPPPPSTALFDLASRNGFSIGQQDGRAAGYNGYPYQPRRTPAYHNAPGYDANLGPFEPYANTFRNAYLRGYDAGFHGR